MRVFPRFALVVLAVALLAAPPLFAEHERADCPLSLVATNAGATSFDLSPHGVFRFGSQVFVLRGQTLSTYAVTDLGDMQIVREDFIGSMAARESNGATAFSNGFLYVSSEAGLEIFDLRGVRAGGTSPIFVSRTLGLHYRRLAVSGSILAGLFPTTDMPCYPVNLNDFCDNNIDLIDVSNAAAPVRVSTISSIATSAPLGGFNDIAFVAGDLVATGTRGSFAYNVSNPATPFPTYPASDRATFLVTNGTNLIGFGTDYGINLYLYSPMTGFTLYLQYTLDQGLTIDRANPIMFHPQAFIDDATGRLITMIDERNPQTLKPARTIAFDVFDFDVPVGGYEGAEPRYYESVTFVTPDEVKYNPVSVGAFIYTVGRMSGLQTWGACGQMTGRIEWDGTVALPCGGAELHGWVTGAQKINSVELFLDAGSLGSDTQLPLFPSRIDVSSRTPVLTWHLKVNLDSTARGEHLFRAIATDALGNRRQFASQRVFFPGAPNNCAIRRRTSTKN